MISAMKIDYEQQSNAEDHYTPSKVWKGAVGVTPPNIEYRMDCKYDFYDSMGRPWEMTDRNGKSTCYIWGYEGQDLKFDLQYFARIWYRNYLFRSVACGCRGSAAK